MSGLTVFPLCFADREHRSPNISPETDTSFHFPGIILSPQLFFGFIKRMPFVVKPSENLLPLAH